MINIVVTYTVEKKFVTENKDNVLKFLEAFKKFDNSKFSYSVFLKADGVTFLHLANYADETIQKQLLAVPEFLAFQQKRDASSLDIAHSFNTLEYIGSSKPIL